MTASQIKSLFEKDTTQVEPMRIKVGSFVKFIDYDKVAQGIGEVQMIEQSKPNAPVKITFKSAVLGHNFIMAKPKDKLTVIK